MCRFDGPVSSIRTHMSPMLLILLFRTFQAAKRTSLYIPISAIISNELVDAPDDLDKGSTSEANRLCEQLNNFVRRYLEDHRCDGGLKVKIERLENSIVNVLSSGATSNDQLVESAIAVMFDHQEEVDFEFECFLSHCTAYILSDKFKTGFVEQQVDCLRTPTACNVGDSPSKRTRSPEYDERAKKIAKTNLPIITAIDSPKEEHCRRLLDDLRWVDFTQMEDATLNQYASSFGISNKKEIASKKLSALRDALLLNDAQFMKRQQRCLINKIASVIKMPANTDDPKWLPDIVKADLEEAIINDRSLSDKILLRLCVPLAEVYSTYLSHVKNENEAVSISPTNSTALTVNHVRRYLIDNNMLFSVPTSDTKE
eukprot:GHVH01016847.1.p2 GENE.GHVH01016847.1~~GHVH01016847.1.p2  ORF type:complete len:371 (+),score=50.25 GHVH01016847.1:180-1292(+)